MGLLVSAVSRGLVCALAIAAATAFAHAEFRIEQTLVPAEDEAPLDLVLSREKTADTVTVSDLRLVVVADTDKGLTRAAADTVEAELRFYADDYPWTIGSSSCVTPRAFGAEFPNEGYDPDTDLVCVIDADGGNFAIRPVFGDDGLARAYDVEFRFAAEGKPGYPSLRADDGPAAFLVNPETMEPLYNGLEPRDGNGINRTVRFVDRQ